MSLPVAQLPADYVPAADALRGRVILITGAAGGLGRATALACARAGATVLVAGRKRRALESVYDELVAVAGAPPPIIQLIDLLGATPADYESLAEMIGSELGRLDGIVHAAARFDGLTPIAMHKPKEWVESLHVNVSAPFLLTQACMPLLQERADSAVVFVLDDRERMGRAHWGAYGTAKAALEGFASILHEETEGSSLRVHALLPAPMRTTLRRTAWFGEDADAVAPPEAAADAVVYLLSPQAMEARGKVLDLRDV
ncbi:MAG TPA: SDR family NAD(P)-dependent oxidoreductase [Rhodanobacteraceae bacterium]|nr:SDR family NAD(P)-dependent oxidoreductase [Rhodanobacteraceae bacterium]